MKRQFKVHRKDQGSSLLHFLRKYCCEAPSIRALKRSIEKKRCTVNDRVETFSTHPLREGDKVQIDWEEKKYAPQVPILLWEDEYLAAYDKSSGTLSCSQNFFCDALLHRLDRETSGVLITAKKREIFQEMLLLFKQRRVHKEYLALVDGVVKEGEKRIVSQLAPRHRWQGQTVYGSSSLGKEAITEWRLLQRSSTASLLLCWPITGRTHQLRVHLKEAGHPVLGDYQYAPCFPFSLRATRHLLHSHKIHFIHPRTGRPVKIIAPLPLDFLEALKYLKLDGKSYF